MARTYLQGNGSRFIAPRIVAARICKQRTKEARASMLMQCPPEIQSIVRTHVANYFARKRHDRNRVDDVQDGQ